MELVNEFRVAVPIDQAWTVLNDIERIWPCMPGAELQSIDGDVFTGAVKVKVGPITAQYKGQATFVERDEIAHRAVIKAEGKESRGQGNANALITALLTVDGDATKVSVTTDLTISGKVAQFGRGVLADVSGKLFQQFVTALEADVLSSSNAAGEPGEVPPVVADAPETTSVADQQVSATEPVNLLGAVALPIAKRVAPLALALLIGYWLLRRRARH